MSLHYNFRLLLDSKQIFSAYKSDDTGMKRCIKSYATETYGQPYLHAALEHYYPKYVKMFNTIVLLM